MITEKNIFNRNPRGGMEKQGKPESYDYSKRRGDGKSASDTYLAGVKKYDGKPVKGLEDKADVFNSLKISSDKNLHEILEVRSNRNLTTAYIDGVSIVSYSAIPREHFGKKIILNKEDLTGELFFNTEFFRKFDLNTSMETESDMENIAKTFFKLNGKNYVALVQYLPEGGRSAEHCHRLEESIIQLAGKSYVELRPVEDDTNYKIIELSQGDILGIPKNSLHFVGTIEGGSLTIPIKQTIPYQKDHLYPDKSDRRILQEVNKLLRAPGYSSGNDAVSALHDYYESLRSDKEKITAMKLLDEKSDKEDNPNIRKILREFKTSSL